MEYYQEENGSNMLKDRLSDEVLTRISKWSRTPFESELSLRIVTIMYLISEGDNAGIDMDELIHRIFFSKLKS